MLHAFCKRKSRLYKRYLGHRDEGEKRVCEEDEITSLIMGPLDYLAPEASGTFWKALVEYGSRHDQPRLPDGAPSFVAMTFWPRRNIEPDLLVELYWLTGERRLLLVEFKWNAPLSGANQLNRQWCEYLTADERKMAYHVFIAPEVSAGLNALGQGDIWNGRLILRSWVSVLDILRRLDCSSNPGLERWKTQVTTFLGMLGVLRFQGFRGLAAPRLCLTSPVFWCPVSGFTSLESPSHFPSKKSSSSFVWSSEQ
jgi:hypothetical protein